MPLFTYICGSDHEADHVFSTKESRPVVLACPDCGQSSQRLFKMPQVISMKPYITTAGDGIPTEIRTSGEERAYEQKHGIAHLTDVDIKQMRAGLRGQKDRIRKRRADAFEPMDVSYAKTEARLKRIGTEYRKEKEAREVHEMANAIE